MPEANKLTYDEANELLDYSPVTGEIRWKQKRSNVRPGDLAGSISRNGNHSYWKVKIRGRAYWAHRVAWLLTFGRWPNALIDHINGDGLDNRLCNLREATNAQNSMNSRRRKAHSSGLKGVKKDGTTGNYQARIVLNGKPTCLGTFTRADEAHKAYCTAAEKHFGEFANDGGSNG